MVSIPYAEIGRVLSIRRIKLCLHLMFSYCLFQNMYNPLIPKIEVAVCRINLHVCL